MDGRAKREQIKIGRKRQTPPVFDLFRPLGGEAQMRKDVTTQDEGKVGERERGELEIRFVRMITNLVISVILPYSEARHQG